MTYDCFSFFNELDLLEIRLNTLDKVVDKFILVEAPWTHTGKPKPLYFTENKRRFAPFLPKIIHIIASDPPVSTSATEQENAWIRENWQRNEIVRGLTGAKPEDIIIIADLDEIPHPKAVKNIIQSNLCDNNIINLNLRCYAFFLNNRCISSPTWTGGPQILNYRMFLSPECCKSLQSTEYCPECANPHPSATRIRFAPHKVKVRNGGWHFSSMGGATAIQKKIKSFAHTEFDAIAKDPEAIEAIIRSGKGFFGWGDRYMPEPLDNGFPAFIITNEKRLSPLLISTDIRTWRHNRLKRMWYACIKKGHDLTIGLAITLIPKPLHPLLGRIRRTLRL